MNVKQKKEALFFSLHSIGALLLGLVCCLCFRPDTWVSKCVYGFFGAEETPFNVGAVLPDWLTSFFCNFFSDMLWAYALTFTVFFFLGSRNDSCLLSFFICAVFEIGMELLQNFSIISGTFDVWDIILELFSTITAQFIIKVYFKEKHHENKL